ncbi:unnamed protein product [Acanthoscelides obtectus]|uniref:Uncharacterized protein n=2 Tax=Acanthoscelides obtectus TaxID=200917 RepID=A0A9P0JZV2_ACAOB|nr:unnamed protein product [Acanthoscelides obtectus]CAK1649341.1 hypothetical protein AOBTE_LOCUS16172 [Acanthoscelides obtectus]
MSSRSKRILELCNNTPHKVPVGYMSSKKDNVTITTPDISEKENFNILDLPVDIVNESFIETFGMIDAEILESVETTSLAVPEFDNMEIVHGEVSEVEGLSEATNFADPEFECSDIVQNQTPGVEAAAENAGLEVSVLKEMGCQKDSEIQSKVTKYRENSFSDEEVQAQPRKRLAGGNLKKINQDLRMKGKQYIGYRRPKNQTNTFHDAQREPRKQSLGCSSQFCIKSSKRKCNEVDESIRQDIFKKFWSDLNWEQRKTYVASLVMKIPVKDKRNMMNLESRRTGTLKYHLKVGSVNMPVCKKMFLSTFGLREWQVLHWVCKSEHGIHNKKPERREIGGIVSNRQSNVFMKQFLNNLNKLPSHCCRKDSKKLYLEQSFRNITSLYQAYVQHCEKSNEKPMSQNSLTKMVKKLNIALYQPKKDACDICCQYEEKNISEETWKIHQAEKERERVEKSKDKEEALTGTQHVLTMDLQAVKVCPSVMASTAYFKTKLCVHNFTVYNLATRDCTCYWFDETSSDLQASTFASFIVDYIRKHFNCEKPIIIYSDGCTYQNRNTIMSNALLHLAMDLNVTIEQKFLIKGHTQMECDSVHATIERKLIDRKIVLPSDYVRICEESTSKPFKHESVMVDHDFFTNYNNVQVYKSIRPGRKVNDPTVTDLRALQYSPTGKIFYKLKFDDPYQELPMRTTRTKPTENVVLTQLPKERLKIKNTKFDHFQKLKAVLSKDVWPFYDQLPHYE